MSDRDERQYPWCLYDETKPLEDRVVWLESYREHLEREQRFYDGVLDRLNELTHEMGDGLKVTATGERGFPSRVTTMSGYWRWVLFEDCMADVPERVERCLQAAVAAAVWP